MAWLYVPGMTASASAYHLPSPAIAQCVTWRGKLMSPRYWSRAWKMGHCLRRLSGLTSRPSAAQGGVGRWISSLRDSRASHGAAQVSNAAQKTTDGCGPTSCALLARWDRGSSSWKTSQGSLWGGSVSFLVRWPRSGSMRSGECFERPMSARHTSGRGFLSWPTVIVADSRSSGRKDCTSAKMHGGVTLTDAMRMWNTVLTSSTRAAHKDGYLTHQLREWVAHMAKADPSLLFLMNGPSGNGPLPMLNPFFAEWLMGLPIGWTKLEPVEMASYQRWRRLHLSNLRGGLSSEPTPTKA